MVKKLDRKRGVTLMELIVVIAIVAILATIAYPTYINTKLETRRAEAQTAVIVTQGIVERYLAENNKANIDDDDFLIPELSTYGPGGTPFLTPNGLYVITVVPDSTSYSINAVAVRNGTTDTCNSVTFGSADQCADSRCWIISMTDGQKTSTDNDGDVADASTTTCW